MKASVHIRHILLIAFAAVCGTAFAGDGGDAIEEAKRICDSLKNELKKSPLTERKRLELYSRITGIYAGFALDSVIVYGFKAISIAEKLNDRLAVSEISCHVGVAYGLLNNFDSAIIMLNRAYELGVETQNDRAKENALWLSAFIYANYGKYVVAIDMYLKLLPLYESMGVEYLPTRVAALANLAELNRKLGNMNIALNYLDQASELCGKLQGAHYIWRISHIYNEYSTVYLLKDNIGQALEYAMKADSVNAGDFVVNKCIAKVLLSRIHLRMNDYERALVYAGEAMESANMLKSNSLYIDVWKVMSDIYLAQRRYPEAEAEALKAWNADSANINESRMTAANLVLASICMHNTDRAVFFFRKYSELNDLYSRKSFHTTVSDLFIKYETEKKEMQLSAITWERFMYFSISIAGILLITAAWAVLRQKMRREQTEKQLLAASSILEGENNERKRISRELYGGITGMISSVKMELNSIEHTQNISDSLDECIEEIHRVADGMMPSSLTRLGMKAALEDCCRRFPDVRFHFFGDDRRIDEKIEVALYYCASELVNNAVKHSGATAINVQMIQECSRISLTVQDNGKGFDKDAVSAKGSGLKNINYRVIAFNGSIHTVSSPDNGTETNIEFKI
jgi:signal transduction histidine kinase